MGNLRAQYNMGKIVRDGIAGPADMEAAAQWFLRAARQGYTKAQNHIGVRYARGEGIESNQVQALMWLTIAARDGHKLAGINRDALTQEMDASGIAEALDLVKSWQPKTE